MFQATDKAVEMLRDYMKEKNLTSKIRVLMAGAG
jgi:hypothetical protein